MSVPVRCSLVWPHGSLLHCPFWGVDRPLDPTRRHERLHAVRSVAATMCYLHAIEEASRMAPTHILSVRIARIPNMLVLCGLCSPPIRFWLTEAQAQVLVEPATFEEARESPLGARCCSAVCSGQGAKQHTASRLHYAAFTRTVLFCHLPGSQAAASARSQTLQAFVLDVNGAVSSTALFATKSHAHRAGVIMPAGLPYQSRTAAQTLMPACAYAAFTHPLYLLPAPLHVAEMVLKMPVVLSKHEKLLDSFRTGVGLSFDDTGIDHCEMHRHAVSKVANMHCITPHAANVAGHAQAQPFHEADQGVCKGISCRCMSLPTASAQAVAGIQNALGCLHAVSCSSCCC